MLKRVVNMITVLQGIRIHATFEVLTGVLLKAQVLGMLGCVFHAVAQLVEALRYKPEGRGSDSRWCHWNFSLT